MMKNKIILLIAGLILTGVIFGGWLMFRNKPDAVQKSEQSRSVEKEQVSSAQSQIESADADLAAEEALVEKEMTGMHVKCENGEWVEVGSSAGEGSLFRGKLTVGLASSGEITAEDEDLEVDENSDEEEMVVYRLNNDKELVADNYDLLDFFEDRTVEIEGVENAGKVTVNKIRCAGKETDKNLMELRQTVMKDIEQRIVELSPKKGDKWEIVDFVWPNEQYVYVEYGKPDTGSDEDTDEFYSILYKVSVENQKVNLEQKSFMKMGVEEWEIISGKDEFQDAEDVDYYEYEKDLGKWVKID
jgi:hypothetical protein